MNKKCIFFGASCFYCFVSKIQPHFHIYSSWTNTNTKPHSKRKRFEYGFFYLSFCWFIHRCKHNHHTRKKKTAKEIWNMKVRLCLLNLFGYLIATDRRRDIDKPICILLVWLDCFAFFIISFFNWNTKIVERDNQIVAQERQ